MADGYRFDMDAERADALERYLLLHSQQQTLCRRLSTSSASSESPLPLSPVTSNPYSLHAPPSPPTAFRSQFGAQLSAQLSNSSVSSSVSSSSSLGLAPSDDLTNPSTPDLVALIHTIKATLTTLLNLPSVRHDGAGELRTWVQDRLMDAEMDLRALRKAHCHWCRPEEERVDEGVARGVVR